MHVWDHSLSVGARHTAGYKGVYVAEPPYEVEIGSIWEILARVAGTGHGKWHNTWGSTLFWMCKVRCWRWLFGNTISFVCRATEHR